MQALAWIAVALLPCAAVASGERPAPRCATPSELRTRAEALKPRIDTRLSLVLPVSWPLGELPAARFLASRVASLPTGTVAYAVYSPDEELTLPLDGAAPRTRKLAERGRLGTWRPSGGDPPASIAAAEEALVRAICSRRAPGELEAGVIRTGYRAWLEREPLQKPVLEREAAAFLAWVLDGSGVK